MYYYINLLRKNLIKSEGEKNIPNHRTCAMGSSKDLEKAEVLLEETIALLSDDDDTSADVKVITTYIFD